MATSTTTSSVDPWLQQFYIENANNLSQQYDIAKNIYNANSAYQPYTGARVQDFTNDQLKGMQMVRDNVGLGQDALAGAVARAGNAAQSWTDRGGQAFAPNAVQTENFTQALGNNIIDPALAGAALIGDRTPQIGQLGQVQGGGYQADSVVADQIGRMQQLANREFDTSAAQQYMNPYTSTALQSTLSEMSRQNDMGRLADQGRAAKAKAFGGSRQAVVQAERDRNFGKAVADTSAKAYDQAYQGAQQQFNTDIGRGLQTGQFNVGTELQRQQQNQQAGLQAGQANQAANAAASQFGLGQNLTAQQLNAANELTRQQANQATGLQSLQLDQASQNQVGLANQQATNNMALANEGNRQQVFGTNAANFFANQQNAFNTQAQNQNMALQGFNANRDQFNTDQTRQLASGQLAGQLAPAMQAMGMQDANNLLATGGMQQQLGQQNLTTGYQDFLNQRAYPYQNFGFLQGALQGQNYNPYQSQQTQVTQASDPSKLGQIAGLASTVVGTVGATGGFGSNGWLKGLWG